MRKNLLLATLGVLLLAFPAALVVASTDTAAGRTVRNVALVVEPTPLREGDTLLYEVSRESEGSPDPEEPWRFGVRVEAPGTVVDSRGETRPADLYLVSVEREGEAPLLARCALHPGTFRVIRQDALVGRLDYYHEGTIRKDPPSWSPLLAPEITYSAGNVTTRFDGSCPGLVMLGAPRVVRGEMVPFGEIAGAERARLVDGRGTSLEGFPSLPARRIDFHGRPALLFEHVFPFERVLTTVAEGVPGIVRSEERRIHTQDGSLVTVTERVELVGFVPGAGPERQPQFVVPPPPAPGASQPYDRRHLELAALGLEYSYEEALQALLDDPDVALAGWLEDHPDAWLEFAAYWRDEAPGGRDSPARHDGAWTLLFSDGKEACWATTARDGAPVGPEKLQDLDRKLSGGLLFRPREEGLVAIEPADPPRFPEGVPGSETYVHLLERFGLGGADVVGVEYLLGSGPPELRIKVAAPGSDNVVGREVAFDGAEGNALEVAADAYHVTGRSMLPTIVEPFPSQMDDRSRASASLGIAPGAGLVGIGAATGVVGILLLVKALLPLYTRLVRDRLLDHPARARLYQHALAHPGVRQAEAIALLGTGEGAARRHLDALCRHGLLVETRVGGMVGYYAAGAVPPEAARQAVVLQQETARRVYDLLREEPGLSLREAGRRLGLSAPSVLRHRRRLEKAGLLGATARQP